MLVQLYINDRLVVEGNDPCAGCGLGIRVVEGDIVAAVDLGIGDHIVLDFHGVGDGQTGVCGDLQIPGDHIVGAFAPVGCAYEGGKFGKLVLDDYLLFLLGGVENIEGIGISKLTNRDVVRHPLVQQIVKAYEDYEVKHSKNDNSFRKNNSKNWGDRNDRKED